MSFGTAIKTCFQKYATFSGRARRSEFWWFYLFQMLVTLPFSLAFVFSYMGIVIDLVSQSGEDGSLPSDWASNVAWLPLIVSGVLMMVVSLALLVPALAVWARRLHDMGQSGHWLWLLLAGLGIVPLIMAILEGERGANRWGPNPAGDPTPPPAYGTPPPAAPPQY